MKQQEMEMKAKVEKSMLAETQARKETAQASESVAASSSSARAVKEEQNLDKLWKQEGSIAPVTPIRREASRRKWQEARSSSSGFAYLWEGQSAHFIIDLVHGKAELGEDDPQDLTE